MCRVDVAMPLRAGIVMVTCLPIFGRRAATDDELSWLESACYGNPDHRGRSLWQ